MTANDAPREPRLQFVALALALLVSIYVALHIFLIEPLPSSAQGCSRDLGWRCFAALDDAGQVRILDPRRAAWYLGASAPREVAWRAEANFSRMLEIRAELQEELTDFVVGLLIDRTAAVKMMAALGRGEDGAATDWFEVVVGSLSLASQSEISIHLSRIEKGLERLRVLDLQQTALIETLAAPWPASFFWQSPSQRLFEVMFWAGFGAFFCLMTRSIRDSFFRRSSPAKNGKPWSRLIYGSTSALLISVILYEVWLRQATQGGWFGWIVMLAFLLGYVAQGLVFGFSGFPRSDLSSDGRPSSGDSDENWGRNWALSPTEMVDPKRPNDLQEMRSALKRWSHEFVEARVMDRGGP
ncbi:hypothetical protein MK280_20150 [Myxococcota bacterium]|nr:hypothetical protein [Myxococcota bacterium]